MRAIDADTVVTIQVFDEMYEEYNLRTMTIAEALDLWTEEGCSSADIVKCKDCRYCTEYYDRDGYPYWECAEWDGGTDADGFCHYGERGEE